MVSNRQIVTMSMDVLADIFLAWLMIVMLQIPARRHDCKRDACCTTKTDRIYSNRNPPQSSHQALKMRFSRAGMNWSGLAPTPANMSSFKSCFVTPASFKATRENRSGCASERHRASSLLDTCLRRLLHLGNTWFGTRFSDYNFIIWLLLCTDLTLNLFALIVLNTWA